MFGVAKHSLKICWPALLTGMLLLSACENDLKKIQEISATDVSKPVQSYKNVDLIYSDSAKVKFRILAPVLMEYSGAKGYREMPKGINMVMFDGNQKQIGTLTADYAIQRESENNIECRKNVVARNEKGETFKSEELVWDEKAKLMHSTKAVQITMANGDIMNGTGFTSDQNFNHWTITNSSGIFHVTDAPTQ